MKTYLYKFCFQLYSTKVLSNYIPPKCRNSSFHFRTAREPLQKIYKGFLVFINYSCLGETYVESDSDSTLSSVSLELGFPCSNEFCFKLYSTKVQQPWRYRWELGFSNEFCFQLYSTKVQQPWRHCNILYLESECTKVFTKVKWTILALS